MDPNLYQTDRKLAWQKARMAYLGNLCSYTDIAANYGIPLSCLSQKASKWRPLRDRIDKKVIDEITKRKKQNAFEVVDLTVANICRSLKGFEKNNVHLSPDDLQKLSSVLINVDKFLRLDAGQATEIIKKQDVTREEVMQMIRELEEIDPNVDYQLADTPEEVLN